MSEKKLTKEQESKLKEIHQEWVREVNEFFDANKDDKINPNCLDGSRTWALAAIQSKYKKKINKELGMCYYEDVEGVKKSSHRKFSDLIVRNQGGFPELPRQK